MNNNENMYKNLALLYLNNKSMDNVLDLFKLDDIYLYGDCRLAELFLERTNKNIKGILDIDSTKQGQIKYFEKNKKIVEIFNPEKVVKEEYPIIIMLGINTISIREYLIKLGVSEKRIYFLNLMLCIGAQLSIKGNNIDWKTTNLKDRPYCLITGTRFGNRGSQAMMLTACSEIKKKYPNALVFCLLNYVEQEYEKNFEKYKIIFLTDGFEEGKTIDELVLNLNLIVDAGGYTIASKGAVNNTERTLRYMKIAFDNNISMYLLPQSFGPLDYPEEKNKLLTKLFNFMSGIYAREKDGYELMKNKYSLTNIYLSDDIVLVKDIINENVYYKESIIESKELIENNSVAIIPNIQLYKYGKKEEVIGCYKAIIENLIEKNKNIYIICTSEDKEISIDIYNDYKEEKKVHFVRSILDVRDFCKYIRQFQYIIASRYHGVILSYKNIIPCIILGWAIKYNRLAERFDQDSYVFDITKEFNIKNIVAALDKMNASHEKEKEVIKKKLMVKNEGIFI